MPGKVQRIPSIKYNNAVLEPLYVVLDSNGSPPILPLLYSAHLSRFGYTYDIQEEAEDQGSFATRLIQKDVSDNTIRTYIYKLSLFLRYLEDRKPGSITDMHGSSCSSEKVVNEYLNDFLPSQVKSPNSLLSHAAALCSFFNWLASVNLCSPIRPRIFRKTRQNLAALDDKEHYIQYVTRHGRLRLLNACPTLGEKLMMRMGFEVGLRASEVAALQLKGPGKLEDLFQKLSDRHYDHRQLFRYHLEGRFTKGGKSRWIYFDRELLGDMRRYFDSERKTLLSETGRSSDFFFLRRDKRYAGTAIGAEQASRVFHRLKLLADLNHNSHFHDLRHTFATELFHEELEGADGRETRSESAALVVVAQRLGHAFTRDGQAPATTTRYIRMRIEMLQLESTGVERD